MQNESDKALSHNVRVDSELYKNTDVSSLKLLYRHACEPLIFHLYVRV